MFDHIDGVMRALAKKKTQWKEDSFFTVKLARQKLSKYYAAVTPTTGMFLISAHILDPFWKLRSFQKWHNGMDTNPEDETSYTTQYKEAFLKYMENEYCAKYQCVQGNKPKNILSSIVVPSAMTSGSGQSFFDPYRLSSDVEEYLTPDNVAETTPGQSYHAARFLTAARLYLNSPPEAPKHWQQMNPDLNNYHSDPMEISSTFSIQDKTDWWSQQEEMHSKYADLSHEARNIFSIIPHGFRVESSFSLGQDVISWRKSKTTGESLPKKVVVRQFARATNRILAGDDPALDMMNTENDLERNLHRIAKVHGFLEMWQGSQNLCAAQKESRAQNRQMTAVGYISDMEEIVKAFCSLFQHDGGAASKLSERSPLPPAVSAKDLPGGRTQILNVHRIWRIICHPVESDENSAPESISDTEDWLNWNRDLDNPNDSEDDCAAEVKSDIEQGNGIKDRVCPEQQDVSAAPYVPGLIRPTQNSKRQAEQLLVTVNAIETRRNKGVKKM